VDHEERRAGAADLEREQRRQLVDRPLELGGQDPGPVTRVVLPRFVAGAAVTVTDLDPDAAFMAVAEHALNLRHVGGDGLVALAEVARGVPCHGLVHGGGPEVVEALRALTEGGNRPI
jgi:hypothetical protein